MAQPSTWTLVKRALARRCPVCGRGAIFSSHFTMNRACPNCHVIFWQDPGEGLGAMYLDYAVAVAVFIAGWIVLALGTQLSNLTQVAILAAASGASVVVAFPFTRSVWTVLVYLSGGIERPRIRAIRGGRR
jgi:uncharacterized protein (DUF983 family)